MTPTEAFQFSQVTNQKLYIVTMQAGPDTFKELVFGKTMGHAQLAAEARFSGKVVNIRRAASHPDRRPCLVCGRLEPQGDCCIEAGR